MMAKQMAVETVIEVNTILSYISSHRDKFGYRYDMESRNLKRSSNGHH
jgi:hypothetical protein